MKLIQKLISVLLSLGLMFVIMAFCLLSSLPSILNARNVSFGDGRSECLSIDEREYSRQYR